MKDFICKKCGNTTYIMQEKLNGTGKIPKLYCAKCGTWHKWLNKQEKVLYSTHSAEIDKDKEIARLTAENQRLKEEAAEQESVAAHEHATQMEWFSIAGDYKAENAELKKRLENAVELPCVKLVNPKVWINRIGIVNVIRKWAVVYIDRQGDLLVIEHCKSKTAAEARLKEIKEKNKE